MRIDRSRRTFRVLVVVAAASAALAACSSQGGAPSSSGGAPASGAPNTAGTNLTFAMSTQEQAGDTVWDKIRAGAQDAAKAHGIKLQYANNENGPEQATLVQNAIDSKVSGIAVTGSIADAVIPVTQKAVAAGIPVVAFNQGITDYKRAGAKMYFGSDETLAGKTIGVKLTQADASGKTLCVIQAQGSVALEARCAGVKQGYANTENLQVNGADLPSVQQTIQSKLAQDPGITNIVTLGAQIALAAQQAKQSANSQATIATFDLNPDAAKAIKDGGIAFSVVAESFIKGYQSVLMLWMNITNGNDLGGGGPVLTGPSIVDSTNIDQILPYTASNRR